jgi:Mycoplasma protein of unknown function, DUF285
MDILRALPSNISNGGPCARQNRKAPDRGGGVISMCDESKRESDFCRRYPIGQWAVEPVIDFFLNIYRNRTLNNFHESGSSWNVANGKHLKVFHSDVSRWIVCGQCHQFELHVSGMQRNVSGFGPNIRSLHSVQFGCVATECDQCSGTCELFSSDVSRWNVASATNLNYMFVEAMCSMQMCLDRMYPSWTSYNV